jgi:hypothetical protein
LLRLLPALLIVSAAAVTLALARALALLPDGRSPAPYIV